MSKSLWTLESGPFGHGMIMKKDALFINLPLRDAFRITGQNLRVKQVKQKPPAICVKHGGRKKKQDD